MARPRRVAWTPAARRTLEEVVSHLAEHSPAAAGTVLDEAIAAAESLATLADRGRMVPELAAHDVREIFVRHYRLMYRVTSDAVAVLAFSHGARDFERWRDGR